MSIEDIIDKKINKDNIEGEIQFLERQSSSDLIHAMEILHSNNNLESNTILTNKQVNALAVMNWASQVYNIEFFKHYVPNFSKYRISGDDGRGRKELIQIAEAIQRDKAQREDRLLDFIGRK